MLKILGGVTFFLIVRAFAMETPDVLSMKDLLETSNFIKSIADENLPVDSLLSNDSRLNEAFNMIHYLIPKFVESGYIFPFTSEIEDDKFDMDLLQRFQRIYLRIARIDYTYKTFLYDLNVTREFNEETLETIFDDVSSLGRTSVQKDLSFMHQLVIPPNDNTLWELLQTYGEGLKTSSTCGKQETLQTKIYKMLGVFILAELKGLVINIFLFKTYFSLKNVATAELAERAQGDFFRRTNQYLQSMKNVLPKINREIYLCDSSSCDSGSDYLELEGVFTALVISEYEVNDVEYICMDNCENIQTFLHRRCYQNNGQEFCTDHRCAGLIHQCSKIGGKVELCEENSNSFKRYRYIKASDTNEFYGKWNDCKNGKYGVLNSFWYRDNQCDVCLCHCSQRSALSRAIRTFSLRPQISNINKNKVVSNFKFVLKDGMIHVQIEESSLQKYGQVDKTQLSWVPLENFSTIDGFEGHKYTVQDNNESITLTENVDYAFVTKSSALINLDEISAGPYYVLTGLRLKREKAEPKYEFNPSPIQLEIHVTPFDFVSGQLNPTEDKPSIWLTSETQPNPPPEYLQNRQENKFGDYVYKYEQEKNIPDVRPNRLVEFKQSSVKSDAGQSTIPFLDARPIFERYGNLHTMALSGAGIIHRKNNKFAGLLALKALTIDLSDYFDTNISQDQTNYYEQLPPLPSKYNELIQ